LQQLLDFRIKAKGDMLQTTQKRTAGIGGYTTHRTQIELIGTGEEFLRNDIEVHGNQSTAFSLLVHETKYTSRISRCYLKLLLHRF